MALCCRPMHQSASDRQSHTRPEGCIVSLYQHHLLGVGLRITWHPWLQLQQVALRLPGRREVQRACLEIAAEQHITSISRTASACRSHRQPASPVSIGLVLRATVGLSRCASSASAAPCEIAVGRHMSISRTAIACSSHGQPASPASVAHSTSGRAAGGAHHPHQLCGDRRITARHKHQPHGVFLQVAPAAGITGISGTFLFLRATVGAHHRHQLHRACVEIAMGRHIMSIIRTAFACRSHRQPASPASVAPCSSGEQLYARIISISCALLVWRSPWDDTS